MLRNASRVTSLRAVTNAMKQSQFRTAKFMSTQAEISSKKYEAVWDPRLNSSHPKLSSLDTFARRHLGPTPAEASKMLSVLQIGDLEEFIKRVVPENVLVRRPLKVEPAQGYTETEMIAKLKDIASKNKPLKSLIGKGYYGTILPPVIQRNLLENPGWYTSYTPYQPEVSQGRLQSLLNFQTMITDLTGLPVANASLLDEGTAAAEAMLMSFHGLRGKKKTYVVDAKVHEQTLAVIRSRANTTDINIVVADLDTDAGLEILKELKSEICGVLIQYPATDGSIGSIKRYIEISELVHANKGLFSVASDLLALTLLHPPSMFNADIVLGTSQRFGVPMGYGGPHAAFFAVQEKLQRKMPGRLIGVSKDRLGNPALRLALQTREQHIKREKATSNICTAQALLANISAMYAIYHGIGGLREIANRAYGMAHILASQISEKSDHKVLTKQFFDTFAVKLSGESSDAFMERCVNAGFNLCKVDEQTVQLSMDETVTKEELEKLVELFTGMSLGEVADLPAVSSEWLRKDEILSHSVFNTYHTETAMLRYLFALQQKDISLATSMIPLGSCTMKLNATVEMLPLSWPEFGNLHPFVPKDQAAGYKQLIDELESDLADITGFAATTLMPNSGAQGEYTALSIMRRYLESIGETNRKIVLIPVSAHGTNPASAAMAGLKVVPVKCLSNGSLDLNDLKEKATKHSTELAAAMITYPSTYGLFEPGIKEAIDIIHSHGGQVYLDGANMNAQVGLTSPGDLGADACHLNLHKTFSIPHGGGGPGVGPICVKEHLVPFLPTHPLVETSHSNPHSIDPVASAPFGSASILPISYSYIKMMGGANIQYSSIIAILNANYMMYRLKDYYEIMFLGSSAESESAIRYCGHEFIIDLRPLKSLGVEAIDVAKRLQDYGFHAPTMSFPVPGTLMVEPTESENLDELNRFVDSMISIRKEIDALGKGESWGQVLKNAPHDLKDVVSGNWEDRGYTREQAAFPLPFLKENKVWPTVARVDDTYGDMNLMCTCPSVEEVSEY